MLHSKAKSVDRGVDHHSLLKSMSLSKRSENNNRLFRAFLWIAVGIGILEDTIVLHNIIRRIRRLTRESQNNT